MAILTYDDSQCHLPFSGRLRYATQPDFANGDGFRNRWQCLSEIIGRGARVFLVEDAGTSGEFRAGMPVLQWLKVFLKRFLACEGRSQGTLSRGIYHSSNILFGGGHSCLCDFKIFVILESLG